MKTRTERMQRNQLIKVGVVWGMLICSTVLMAASVDSDKDKTNKSQPAQKASETEMINFASELIAEDAKEIKLDSWVYKSDAPLWMSILEEEDLKEDKLEIESWMSDTSEWAKKK
ncbi:MAG: hypothetical protein JW801_19060 [Bacteroidales bacterium]|nr:hypothetical protein [Bacteroidales bacterium]